MPQYIITPWAHHNELLEARQHLYGKDCTKDVHEQRNRAVQVVAAWKLRGNLPYAVESTALIVDAVLHHDATKTSLFCIRAAYAMALARFVTGFCDTAQTSVGKKSMYDMAESYGMPLTFVELRHEITHGQIPSVQTLQRHATEALDWLWKQFWVKLVPDPPPSSETNRIAEEETVAREARVVVSTYLAARIAKLKGGAAGKKRKTASTEAADPGDEACRALVRLCQNKTRLLEVLSAILVQSRKLIPKDYKLNDTMDGAFQLWDDLLHRLTAHQRDFLQTLIARMLTLLIEPAEYLDTSQDPFREAIFRWLAHIFTADGWSHSRGLREKAAARLRSEAVGKCITAPVYWAQRLALVLVKTGGTEFKRQWQPVVAASFFIQDGKVVMPGKHAGGLDGILTPAVVFGQASALGQSDSTREPTETMELPNSMPSEAASRPLGQASTSEPPTQEQSIMGVPPEQSSQMSRRPSVVFGEPSAPGQLTPDRPANGRALAAGLPIYPVTAPSPVVSPLATTNEPMRDRSPGLPARGWRRAPGVWRPKPIGLIDLPGDEKYR